MGGLLIVLYYLAIFILGALILIFNLPFSPLNNKNRLPWNWPILGMLPGLAANFNNLLNWATMAFNESGQTTFMINGPRLSSLNLLITMDLTNIKYTSSTWFSNFPRGPKSLEIFDVFGEGFFNMDGEEWAIHRNINRSFFGHKLFNECSSRHAFEKVEKRISVILHHVVSGDNWVVVKGE